jgi:hypothetical protein
MGAKEMRGLFSRQQRSCDQINDAHANMKPFVLTTETVAPIRTGELRILVEETGPIFDVSLQFQGSLFTEFLTSETII